MDPTEIVLAYHQRTKHHPFRYARSLGYMDWDTQPDPFRRYHGAPLFPLDLIEMEDQPNYETALLEKQLTKTPAALDRKSISQLFQDSLALSAWKEAGTARWSLRVNPSSGNLHPTEGYLVAGPVAGLSEHAGVFHYAPHEHGLELRATLSAEVAERIFAQLPAGAVIVGLSTIWWREGWKYGERAFRYCQHDVGHAIGAVAVAAAGLGWAARLLEGVIDEELAGLLGIGKVVGSAEAEDPDCLIAVYPATAEFTEERQRAFSLKGMSEALAGLLWNGVPNTLSSDHHPWPEIDEVASATHKLHPPAAVFWRGGAIENPSLVVADSARSSSPALRTIIHQRRSAVAFDGHTGITREAFFQILIKAMPGAGQVPFATLPWSPRIDLLLMVHRVKDLASGLYVLCRDPGRREELKAVLAQPWPAGSWTVPEGCPPSLPLFLLEAGDARSLAEQVSCGQGIAKDGVFAAAMLADYWTGLLSMGPWFYKRLHWEAGALGQLLYLEAEASGIRATGIGCYFDDATHRAFGIGGDARQVLYHFTMGGAVEDERLKTAPPYAHLSRVTIGR